MGISLAVVVAALCRLTYSAGGHAELEPARSPSASPVLAVWGLRVQHLVAPLGIDVARPRFSWRVNSTAASDHQAAYLLTLWRSTGRAHVTVVWSSGRVATAPDTPGGSTSARLPARSGSTPARATRGR